MWLKKSNDTRDQLNENKNGILRFKFRLKNDFISLSIKLSVCLKLTVVELYL